MQYLEINSKATFVVKTGPGVLAGIMVNNAGTGWTLQVFDNISAVAPAIAGGTAFAVPAAGSFLNYGGLGFSNGLTIVSGGSTAGSITVIYY